jgi:hypothetical protein
MKTLVFILVLLATPALADDTAYFTYPEGDGVGVVVGVPKADLVRQRLIPAPGQDRNSNIEYAPTDEEYENYIRTESEQCKQFTCTKMPDDWWPPFDRRLRAAWKQRDKDAPGNFTDMGEPMRGIEIDMVKAKGLWKAAMEQAALQEASTADSEAIAADIKGDNAAKVAAVQKRQRLNGIVPQAAIDAAVTPEQLMALWPAELEKHKPSMPVQADVTGRRADRNKVK